MLGNFLIRSLVLLLTGTALGLLLAFTLVPIGNPNVDWPNGTDAVEIFSNLPAMSEDLIHNRETSVVITKKLLHRIEALDTKGPTLNSVLAINPDALKQAASSDARRAVGTVLSPLDGVPILLKDNIESSDPLPTTAGSSALILNETGRDSPLVANLRAAGAVILGKTNLSQWANFRSSDSISGWSSVGGLVKNPHSLNRTACGSSSGSGAAVAASLAPGAVGTETNGSIICPANSTGVVGFKPSHHLVPSKHIVPIAPTQDTAGPMTKTVKGAAMLLDGMTGYMHQFNNQLTDKALKGVSLGVLRFSVGDQPLINLRFEEALSVLEKAGAKLVDISAFEADPAFRSYAELVLLTEFKAAINSYLATTPSKLPVQSLQQLIAYNQANKTVELPLFGQDLFIQAQNSGGIDDPKYLDALASIKVAAQDKGIDLLLKHYDVTALIAPSGPIAPPVDFINGDIWPDWVGAGYLAAIAGYPHLTVPMGSAKGMPVGLSFIGTEGTDALILSLGFSYEQRSLKRVTPELVPSLQKSWSEL